MIDEDIVDAGFNMPVEIAQKSPITKTPDKRAIFCSKWLILIVAALAVSGLYATWTVRRTDQQMRAELLLQTNLIAKAIDVGDFSSARQTILPVCRSRHLFRYRVLCPHRNPYRSL